MDNSILKLIMEECINLQGKPASVITSYLKSLGGNINPTMAKGLLNILEATEKNTLERIANARLGGIVIGVTSAAFVSAMIHLLLKRLEKEQSRKKIQEVAEILKQEASLENDEKPPVGEDDTIEED